jgi:hypothetical protein
MADLVLSDALNWDDPNIVVETAQKLIGAGSYKIASNIPERQVEITINHVGNWKVLFRNLSSLAIAETEITLTKITTETGDGSTETQVLKGQITSVTKPTAKETWADIKIVVLCTTPTPVTTIT